MCLLLIVRRGPPSTLHNHYNTTAQCCQSPCATGPTLFHVSCFTLRRVANSVPMMQRNSLVLQTACQVSMWHGSCYAYVRAFLFCAVGSSIASSETGAATQGAQPRKNKRQRVLAHTTFPPIGPAIPDLHILLLSARVPSVGSHNIYPHPFRTEHLPNN